MRWPLTLALAVLACQVTAPAESLQPREPGAVVLVISQPPVGMDEGVFVDMTPHLVRALEATGAYRVVPFAPSSPALRAAIDAGRLTAADVTAPVSAVAARRIALAVGATQILRAAAYRTAAGIAGDVALESRVGQAQWSTVFTASQPPVRARDRRTELLEGIYGQVSAIVTRMTGSAPALPPEVQPPVRQAAGRAERRPARRDDRPARDARTPDAGRQSDGGRASEPTRPEARPAATEGSAAPPRGAGQRPGDGSVPRPADSTPPEPSERPGDALPTPAVASQQPAAREVLIDRFRRQGDLANLIVSLRRAINDRPRDARLRRELVQAYRERGMPAAARDEVVRAVAIAPEDPVLRRMLGDAHLYDGNVEAAVREYQEAVRLQPGDPLSHVALGDAYWNSGRSEEAMQAYEAGARADARHPLPHRRRALVHARRNQLAEAAAAMKLAREAGGVADAEAYARDAIDLARMASQNLEEALAELQRARRDFVAGSVTREAAHKAVVDTRIRLSACSDFLAELPAPDGLAGALATMAQAAALAAQSGENLLLFLETQSELADRESTFLRMEAARQLADGAKRLQPVPARQ
ncbi:MAG TPA: tetratricopeptide repeat protein [Chthonomonadales bacterium]|nr:tetratricopeptide repeat protein [Chthonomonadales bacterium]